MQQFIIKHFKLLNKLFGRYRFFQVLYLNAICDEIEQVYIDNYVKQQKEIFFKGQKSLAEYYIADCKRREGVL